MSEALRHRAEVLKLARLLDVDPAALPDLGALTPAQVRELRERATDRLFEATSSTLGAVGAASRLVPSGLAATVAERAFGPLLCARTAAAIPPAKAVDIAGRMSATFLADVAIRLDPRRVAAIVAAVPADLVVPVTAELGRRGEHVTMGRFLGYVGDDAVRAAMGVLDDEALLRTAFVLEHPERLDRAVELLAPGRMAGILRTAARLALWPEALGLIGHLSPQRAAPVAEELADLEHDVVATLVDAVQGTDLWEALLPLVPTMADDARRRLAAAPAFHDEAVLAGIVAAGGRTGLRDDLLPLVQALPDEPRGTAERLLSEAGRTAP